MSPFATGLRLAGFLSLYNHASSRQAVGGSRYHRAAIRRIDAGYQLLIADYWPQGATTMSYHSIEELIELWKREKLTVEQMIGQMLQSLQAQQQRLRELERRLTTSDAPSMPAETTRRK
jgi:hypothetical protein